MNAVWMAAGLVASLLLAGASAQQAGHLPTTTQLAVGAGDAASGAGGRLAAGSGSGVSIFTIKVSGGDRGVPSGTVRLSDGVASLGSVLLDETGSATYRASTAAGRERVTAIYEGDASFDPSSSLTVAAPAASTTPTFTLAGTPTTLSVKAGNFVTSTISVLPVNGFQDTVMLSCSGLPPESTCLFNPTNVTPGGTAAATSILTIQTLAPSGAGTSTLRDRPSGGEPGTSKLYAVLAPGFAALAGLGLLRRRVSGLLRMLGIVALLVGCGLGLGACSPRYSYFHHPPLKDPGTTVGTFTVLVNGSSANAGSVIIPPAVSIVLTVTQ
ncbi:MAG TPA: Ig-like domain-containing protein [Acidisarcina sp.]